MQTILRKYEFDVATPAGKEAWAAFKLEREQSGGGHIFGPVFHEIGSSYALDGVTLELDTKHLHENQWTATEPGGKQYRVFDWFLQAHGNYTGGMADASRPNIRRGHYLEQTNAMKEIRRNTNACGYCGNQEPAAAGAVFCPKCLDSEYLTIDNLPLLRMQAVDDRSSRGPLSAPELDYILPLYRQAQIHGNSDRAKKRIAANLERVHAKYAKATRNATNERDGFLWLMERGINTANVIYYDHTERFCFGWQKKLEEPLLGDLLNVISEFGWPYRIECADGRKLEGN